MSKDKNIPPNRPSGFGRKGQPFKHGNVDENGDYIVGRGRTPDHTRFAKNDGRPRGRRPKGVKNEKSDWEDELNERVSVTIDGKPQMIPKRRLLVKTTVTNGIKGDIKAAELSFRRIDRHGIGEERAEEATLAASDHEIISAFYHRMKRQEEGGGDDGA